jgi:hypothetical protein
MPQPRDSGLTLADLERWELFGATWRVGEIASDHVIIDLCACTGDLVERRESRDAELIDRVRALRLIGPP